MPSRAIWPHRSALRAGCYAQSITLRHQRLGAWVLWRCSTIRHPDAIVGIGPR